MSRLTSPQARGIEEGLDTQYHTHLHKPFPSQFKKGTSIAKAKLHILPLEMLHITSTSFNGPLWAKRQMTPASKAAARIPPPNNAIASP